MINNTWAHVEMRSDHFQSKIPNYTLIALKRATLRIVFRPEFGQPESRGCGIGAGCQGDGLYAAYDRQPIINKAKTGSGHSRVRTGTHPHNCTNSCCVHILKVTRLTISVYHHWPEHYGRLQIGCLLYCANWCYANVCLCVSTTGIATNS